MKNIIGHAVYQLALIFYLLFAGKIFCILLPCCVMGLIVGVLGIGVFSSYEAGITDVITSFKWMKNAPILLIQTGLYLRSDLFISIHIP